MCLWPPNWNEVCRIAIVGYVIKKGVYKKERRLGRMVKVGVLIGSLRKSSLSQQLALNVGSLFPENYQIEVIEIGHLPFYNQDFDDYDQVPESFQAFREKIQEMDAFLFVTPEYNRSVPAVLSNAIDIGSRPKIDNAWDGKPGAIISQSPGNFGGFGANHHLRQVLSAVNVPVVQSPEVYLSHSAKLLDEQGKLNNEGTVQFLQSFVEAFIELIKKYSA